MMRNNGVQYSRKFVIGVNWLDNFYQRFIMMNQCDLQKMLGEITCKKIQNYIFNFADLLGQGNFSKVYKAHNEITNEVVAIKIIELNSLKSEKLKELLFSEIDVLKQLNHPNVLRCFEVFTSNHNCYIITEYCGQGDLETKLQQKGTLSETQCSPYIRDIFNGLLYLAENNIIHRDLKLANIFLNHGNAKIADFGFAKFTKTKFRDMNIGSPIYMSPEGLIDNIYGPKTDIWSFGVMLFELLHGTTPFSFCHSERELKIAIKTPIDIYKMKSEISLDLREAIMKCLEVDEERRMTAVEMKEKVTYFRKMFSRVVTSSGRRENSDSDLRLKKPFINELINKIYTLENKGKIRSLEDTPEKRPQNSHPHELKRQKLPSTEDNGSTEAPYGNYKSAMEEPLSKNAKQPEYNIFTTNSFTPITSFINFKTCVNILHYCRLIYKHIMLSKETSLQDEVKMSVFKKWLLIMLQAILRHVESKKITYEGEHATSKKKKLEEVTQEYYKKYTRELELDSHSTIDRSMSKWSAMQRFFLKSYEEVDQQIKRTSGREVKALLALGHSIIMICEVTALLENCSEKFDYGAYESYKDLEIFLTMERSQMDRNSYALYRCKLAQN